MTFKYKIKHGRPSILQVRKKNYFFVELFVELAVRGTWNSLFKAKAENKIS